MARSSRTSGNIWAWEKARRLAFFAILMCGVAVQATASTTDIEGNVELVRPMPNGGVELRLVSGTNHFAIEIASASGKCPTLSSRVRAPKSKVERLDQIQTFSGYIFPLLTNIAEIRHLGASGQHNWCVADLEGIVLAVGSRGTLALQDSTGIALLQIKSSRASVSPGQRIRIEDNCLVEGNDVFLGDSPTVDNNDLHGMLEKSGVVYLTSGKHPFHLDWFNRDVPFGLEVFYQGPDVPRQKIPDAALFRRGPAGTWVNGVDYKCTEGSWLRVPDFDRMVPGKSGTCKNFDLSVCTRPNDVGLQFSGYVEAPRDGLYTFSAKSDDGSLMFIDEPPAHIEALGTNALPQPVPVSVRQILRPDQDDRWSQVEGTVTFAGVESGSLKLELSSETGRMPVEVADGGGDMPEQLLNKRVRATGICLGVRTADGQIVAGTLLVPGANQLELRETSPDRANASHGKPAEALPLLTTVEQIKRLSHDECQRSYPVRIRGVVTTVLDSGIFLQDSTRSIYVRWQAPTDNDVPRVGDYWEVEGKTFVEFAPSIQASRAARLDAGTLPEPLHPTWDQLMNGSLDTAYVELQGIVTGLFPGGITLLTRAGTIVLQLPAVQSQDLRRCENALIRVRGCVVPVRDDRTQQVKPGRMSLVNVSITVDEPAPADPFAIKLKRVADMYLFDSRAGALQRVRVGGQIAHVHDNEYYLTDGGDGLRFFPRNAVDLHPGDLVEVVGFAELGGNSPILREAVVRRTGSAPLPEAPLLPYYRLLDRRYEGTLARIQARLENIGFSPGEQVLELQAGTHAFVARLKTRHELLHGMVPGSLVEVTGVYVGQGSDLASGRDISSFELLLNSENDIKVLDRPSWWTFRHTLAVLGGMSCIILAALVWIALLHRQVEERSSQLAEAIRRQEQTERQRELELERRRIAHDLHDDLGATLTQIRFLSVLESRDSQLPEHTRNRLGQVSEKSREMVTSLDEIVWAVNPANDSLPNLANYLCHFAEEFFRPVSIRCRLDVDDSLPPVPLTSEVRHNLYLAVREALNNIAKHSQASEAWLRIHREGSGLSIIIEDNGRGLPVPADGSRGEGLGSMKARLEKIGGRFECETPAAGGVICRLYLPLKMDSVRATQS